MLGCLELKGSCHCFGRSLQRGAAKMWPGNLGASLKPAARLVDEDDESLDDSTGSPWFFDDWVG